MVSIHVPARGTTSVSLSLYNCAGFVSIHVPARGTTGNRQKRLKEDNVSIHVPARGTTCGLRICSWFWISFNPRSRTGNDHFSCRYGGDKKCFNPRSRTGNDTPGASMSGRFGEFQSTFPHGERRLRFGIRFKICKEFL